MKRNIVRIDQSKCNGCGKCIIACHEGAIQLVDGKAQLLSEVYCDGLGACLGDCPTDAITIEERDAAAFDEAAVAERQRRLKASSAPQGCPGMRSFTFGGARAAAVAAAPAEPAQAGSSELTQWPVQLRLVPAAAPWWDDADVLLAADCVAVAVPDFQQRLLRGRKVAVMCPKLDDPSGTVEKLTEILAHNRIRSLTVARMHVPCCGGVVRIAEEAIRRCGRSVPLTVAVFDHTGALQS